MLRLSTALASIAVAAALLAFWRLKPPGGLVDLVPFEFLVVLLAIILATLAVMLRAFRQE